MRLGMGAMINVFPTNFDAELNRHVCTSVGYLKSSAIIINA